MQEKLRVLMIGPHPDDCDFRAGGTAIRYARAGHTVKFLAMCNGCYGHHVLDAPSLAARRAAESRCAAAVAGLVDYEVWDINDCELEADLATRKRLIRSIRRFRPDIIFCVRSNDYHADHRYSALLVQDAAYLLLVPHFCADAPALDRMPVIMHFFDSFSQPCFAPDVVVPIDDVIETKYRMWHCHQTQVYEWLPHAGHYAHTLPAGADERARLAWLREPCVRPGDTPPPDLLARRFAGARGDQRNAAAAFLYRAHLVACYGKKGRSVVFAEAFAASEYGSRLTAANRSVLFPFR